jgi:hypothetical protein
VRLTNLNSIETIRKVVTSSGTPEVLSPQYTATTIAFANNWTVLTPTTRDTITDSAAQFLVEGFAAGDVIDITGSTSNDGQYEIYSVAAGTITLTKSGILTSEIAGDVVTVNSLHGVKVPDGCHVVIKAEDDNTGNITLGDTSAKALNTNANYFNNFTLSKGQSVEVYIKNLNLVWFDATVSDDGVEIIFEK